MLYIDEIDSYNIRLSDEADGAGYVRIFRKPLVSVSDEIQGITIYDPKKQEQILYKYLPANITLSGTVLWQSPTNWVTEYEITDQVVRTLQVTITATKDINSK